MPNYVKLVLGDPYADGHGISCSVLLETEYSVTELQSFLKNAEFISGVDLSKIAHEYEEPFITKEVRALLLEHGVIGPEDLEEDEGENRFYVGVDEFIGIFVGLAELGNKGKPVGTIIKVPELDIGGYGLFSH